MRKIILTILALLVTTSACATELNLRGAWTYDDPSVTGFKVFDHSLLLVKDIPDATARTTSFTYNVDECAAFYLRAYRVDGDKTIESDISNIAVFCVELKVLKSPGFSVTQDN